MDKAFSRNSEFDSNSGILDAFYREYVGADRSLPQRSEQAWEILRKIVKILTGARARCLAKAFAVATALIGLIGVAGAIEMENISLSAGLGLSVLLVAIEYLALRGRK